MSAAIRPAGEWSAAQWLAMAAAYEAMAPLFGRGPWDHQAEYCALRAEACREAAEQLVWMDLGDEWTARPVDEWVPRPVENTRPLEDWKP